MKRQCYCHNCGADLGVFDTWPGDVLDCGSPECSRETRAVYRERDDAARESAERDDYDRYR